MFVTGECKKCKTKLVFDITGSTVEAAKLMMEQIDMGECPGMHVEIGKMADYYIVDWSRTFKTQEEAKKHNKSLAA